MDKEKLKKLRRSDFFKAVFLIIFVFVTGWVIFGFTRVYGSAMKPAACDGDILMYYRLHTEYKAGDMVVYQADGLLHIGRIAAVPEETVQPCLYMTGLLSLHHLLRLQGMGRLSRRLQGLRRIDWNLMKARKQFLIRNLRI